MLAAINLGHPEAWSCWVSIFTMGEQLSRWGSGCGEDHRSSEVAGDRLIRGDKVFEDKVLAANAVSLP
jgi:hypothetical protein